MVSLATVPLEFCTNDYNTMDTASTIHYKKLKLIRQKPNRIEGLFFLNNNIFSGFFL